MGFVDKQVLVPSGLLVLYWANDGTTLKSFFATWSVVKIHTHYISLQHSHQQPQDQTSGP